MKDLIANIITGIVLVLGIVFGVLSGINLSSLQLDTLIILVYICAGSALYCFVVGEITRNNSQMDKLWSVIPLAYVWVIASKSNFNMRVTVMAVLVTLWGIRLTSNFARKGAYKLKFWEGEEDYRWPILRKNKILGKRSVWALFDLFFISIYQNAIVLAIAFPLLAVMESNTPFGVMDYVALGLVAFFILYETIADEQQMAFQTTKYNFLKEGKKLEELPSPFNLGFNTVGLWNHSRHPNYLAEQAIWVCLYLFVIGAGLTKYGIFNWSILGCLFLIMLFMGSSMFGEAVSSSKYPEYKKYSHKVFKYLPIFKYRKPAK